MVGNTGSTAPGRGGTAGAGVADYAASVCDSGNGRRQITAGAPARRQATSARLAATVRARRISTNGRAGR